MNFFYITLVVVILNLCNFCNIVAGEEYKCDFTDCMLDCKKQISKPGVSPFVQAYCIPVRKNGEKNVFTVFGSKCVCTTHPPPEFVEV
uniref:Venom protein n=1 Tax=Strongyloides venezuelensis TaxID=75913 RepID=A0A0K0EYI8_STRVS